MTDAFEDLEARFEAANPGYEIELNLAGSSGLRAQILSGAPADVFASANQVVMDQVVAGGTVVGQPTDFATNRLQIAVPIGNPADIATIEDFARPDLFLGLCNPSVPCGSLAEAALAEADVTPSVDTREPDVRALLTKIALRELDGGIVYATDVAASPDEVEAVAVADDLTGRAVYPVAVLDQGENTAGGQAFVSFLLADEGRGILVDRGFELP